MTQNTLMSEINNYSDNMDPSHNFHDEMLEPNVIIKEDHTDEVLEPNVIIKEELNENDGGEWNDNQDYLDFYNAGSYPYYPANYTSQSYESPTEQNFTGIVFLTLSNARDFPCDFMPEGVLIT